MTCHSTLSRKDTDTLRARMNAAKLRVIVNQSAKRTSLEEYLGTNLPQNARRTDSPLRSDRAGGSLAHPSHKESRPLFPHATDATETYHDLIGAAVIALILFALSGIWMPLS